MAADGSGMQQVTSFAGGGANPDFSPDANSIAFEHNVETQRSDIFITSRASRAGTWSVPRREITTDGKMLYFTIAQQESDIWVLDIAKR